MNYYSLILSLLLFTSAQAQTARFFPGATFDYANLQKQQFAVLPDGHIATWFSPRDHGFFPFDGQRGMWTNDETEIYSYTNQLTLLSADHKIIKRQAITISIQNANVDAFNFAFFGGKLYAFAQITEEKSERLFVGEVDIASFNTSNVTLLLSSERLKHPKLPEMFNADLKYIIGIPRIIVSENGRYLMLLKKIFHPAGLGVAASSITEVHHADVLIYHDDLNQLTCEQTVTPKEGDQSLYITDAELHNNGTAFFTDGASIVALTPAVKRIRIILPDKLVKQTFSAEFTTDGNILCSGWTSSKQGLSKYNNLYFAEVSPSGAFANRVKIYEKKELLTDQGGIKNTQTKNMHYRITHIVSDTSGASWIIMQHALFEGFKYCEYGNIWILKLNATQEIEYQTVIYTSHLTPRDYNMMNNTPYKELYFNVFYPVIFKGELNIFYMDHSSTFTEKNEPYEGSEITNVLGKITVSNTGSITKSKVQEFNANEIQPLSCHWFPVRIGQNQWAIDASTDKDRAYGIIELN